MAARQNTRCPDITMARCPDTSYGGNTHRTVWLECPYGCIARMGSETIYSNSNKQLWLYTSVRHTLLTLTVLNETIILPSINVLHKNTPHFFPYNSTCTVIDKTYFKNEYSNNIGKLYVNSNLHLTTHWTNNNDQNSTLYF